MTHIEAMKLALEALEVSTDWDVNATGKQAKSIRAITALRAAIEQAEKQEVCARCGGIVYDPVIPQKAEKQEPVAWMHWLHGPVRLFLNKDEATMELDRLNREYPVDADGRKMRPLVFGDTSPPQRKPLTDEQIAKCYETTGHYQTLRPQDRFAVFALARAIEAAHGIKE